ncbi:hypothetical protein A4A49_52587, partial [Nicotiana attenuata]
LLACVCSKELSLNNFVFCYFNIFLVDTYVNKRCSSNFLNVWISLPVKLDKMGSKTLFTHRNICKTHLFIQDSQRFHVLHWTVKPNRPSLFWTYMIQLHCFRLKSINVAADESSIKM